MPLSVLDFYKDQTVFITGGTGFVGKVLIEKLLRTCQVSKILVMVRPKHGKTTEERFEKMFSYPCFEGLKSKNFDFKSKVEFILGDCFAEKLGMSENDRNYIEENVDIMVHSAADVRFDRPLKLAAYCNVRAVRDVLSLAKNMKKLKSLVHVSTAFSFVDHEHNNIKEEIYEPGMSAEQLLLMVDTLDENTLNLLTPRLLGKWANTYVYTKAIAEDLIKREGNNLPVAIVRPSVRAAEEPMPGWIDNFYGPFGMLTGIYVGAIRAVWMDMDKSSECAPVDFVSNFILTVGWKTHREAKSNKQIEVYNFAGSNDNVRTWRQASLDLDLYAKEYPSNKTVWRPFYFITPNRYFYFIVTFLLHTLPSYLIDLVLIVIGKKPLAVKGYRKLHRLTEMTSYFGLQSWNWDDDKWKGIWKSLSESDKKTFNFDFDTLDWRKYTKDTCDGARIYLVKDPLTTMDAARRRKMVLDVIHYVLVVMLLYGLCKFLYPVLLKRLL